MGDGGIIMIERLSAIEIKSGKAKIQSRETLNLLESESLTLYIQELESLCELIAELTESSEWEKLEKSDLRYNIEL